MSAVVILYTPPEQTDEFELRYHADYLPSIRALPAVSRVSTRRVAGGPFGDPPFYRIETWHLAAEAEPGAVFQGSAWRSAPETLGFARGLATPMFVEEHDGDR